MARNIMLKIQYDGSRFDGWQRQGNTQNTLQGRIEALLSIMTGESIEIHGSGRTDAGVHAMAQVANFRTDCKMSCGEMFGYINKFLPRDCAVLAVEEADTRFHARLNAKRKHYRYRIRTSAVPDVFSRKYVWELNESLDLVEMKLAIDALIGEHDFAAFCDNKRMKKSTVRKIFDIKMLVAEDELVLDFYGNGFLYHMVRLLVGTLVEVGLGNFPSCAISELLSGNIDNYKSRLAPASGLCLVEVFYD